ncbi:MAG: Ankyrin repeat domain-containing protein 44 [Bathelium mastoideum]|nr:MAG: Ankyrin repeat domain-containing protein 44 [Bathelium mastoideum]
MLDPLTTLGLISNVLQVADFSLSLLAKSRETASAADGAIDENRDTEKCAKELILRNHQLSESLAKNSGGKDGWDNDDVILSRLGYDCNTTARELIECLSDLRSYQGRSAFKNIRQAIKTVHSREKVESISKRMKGFQEQMNSALLQSISLRQRLINAEQTERFNDLDHGESQIVDSVRNLQTLFTSQLNSQTDILTSILATQHGQTRDLLNNLSFKDSNSKIASVDILDCSPDGRTVYRLAEEGSAKEIQALLRRRPEAARSSDDNGRTPLHFAAKSGHADLVSYFIRKGADANAEDDSFITPLHLAAEQNHVSIVRVLIQKGADPLVVDAKHRQPRQCTSNEEILWILSYGPELDALDSDGNPALFKFTLDGKPAVVESLLNQKATPDIAGACGGLPLMKAAEFGHLRIAELLYGAGAKVNARSRNNRLDTALGLAAMKGHLGIAKELLEWGAEVDAMNGWRYTPLNEACAHGHERMAIHLIERGANPNTEDHLGCVPIIRAAETGCVGTVRALLEAGADAESERSSDKRTALAEACSRGNSAMVMCLLKGSASPDHRDSQSWTPLHLAARHGHTRVIKLLLNCCPDLDYNVETNEGESPVLIADKYGHREVAAVILAHAAIEAKQSVQYLWQRYGKTGPNNKTGDG